MTFRFPFQISRCVSAAKSYLPDTSRKCRGRFSTHGKTPLLKGNSTIQKRTGKLAANPTNFLVFVRNFAWKQTDPVHRAMVRKQNKCEEKQPKVKRLKFRNTTKEDCEECGSEPLDMYAPKLKRPKQRYDASKMKWKHEGCEVLRCEDMPRADGVIKIKRKRLTKIKMGNCEECSAMILNDSPGFKRLKKRYDPSKMVWDHGKCPVDECDLSPPRSDDTYCFMPTKKILPSYNTNDKHKCP